ncbi:hypothetical protein NLG97_g1864 [Lecanicillium saksenae]|uniref:Uncharacterized protein n=1 Tax=Lecanicillium saksenae TaxID=468837 RepID=A0ACC1R5U9_9HYPO|nr:hypothetical protein NLG97_g1864 [Lecanicillium saksenae]
MPSDERTDGSAVDDADSRETEFGPPQRKHTLHNYNSFPSYNTVQHETSDGYETTQYTAAGGKIQIRVLGPDLLRGLLMMLMAMDHLTMALRSWEHGQGRINEQDGLVVEQWNRPVAYTIRSLTHLCAPGFMLLLGMGVVYLGNSRKKQGWSSLRLLRYFALRMVVLVLVMLVHGLVLTGGNAWFLNIVLFALAVNYFLTGAIWLAVYEAENKLTLALTRVFATEESGCDNDSDSDAEQPLLLAGRPQMSAAEVRATNISQRVLHLSLVVLSLLTIFWNIWLSENHGQCVVEQSESTPNLVSTMKNSSEDADQQLEKYWWLHIWLWQVVGRGVMSGFPPLAWLSFAVIGVLYGRLVIGSSRVKHGLISHVGVGLIFTLIFVLTRLLNFGNLSGNCLQTPENKAHPNRNQYLVSAAAFFYTIKYPPDVAFWAFTLAGNFFLLAGLRQIPTNFAKKWLAIMLDFGTTALFFYVVHFPVVFLVGGNMCALFGHPTDKKSPEVLPFSDKVIDNAFAFFGIWGLCLLIMWPLCRWYSKFKFGKPSDSLWRIF